MQRDEEADDTGQGVKKATLRFPLPLHRWFRHWAVDADQTFEEAVLHACAEWAAQHGYSPDDGATRPGPPLRRRPG